MSGTKAVHKLNLIQGGSESKFEVLFENASDAILVVDLKSQMIESANQAACELTGYLKSELVGASIEMLTPNSSQESKLLPEHSNALAIDHLKASGFFEDIVLISKDRHFRFVTMSVKTMRLQNSSVAMCILRDVGEKKKMERDLITKHSELRNAYISLEKANAELKSMQETLVQAGKLAALGELAAGIAHELNQPLTAIKGFAQEALSGENTSDCLSEIVKGSEKMERIISHLRNFTRKSTQDFQQVDIHTVINESLLMLEKQFKSRGIKIEKDFDKDAPLVYCNPFQLEQVFINFATNARDAIEEKKSGSGLYKIQTRVTADKFIEIRFEDNGCGISEANKGRIFNPFFTTKEVGKGMGLGLSISYGILSKINASIVVESGVGKGTTFIVKLPVDYRKH